MTVKNSNKIAMITGATAGIGKATALKFAAANFNLIITGRRAELLDDLSKKIIKDYGVKVYCMQLDVRIKEDVEIQINKFSEDWKKIDVLVNNAGLAVGLGTIQQGEIDDWERMIDTNIKGLLYVSRAVMPIMIANGYGHIVNIGSIAGREVYPNGNVYCGTKAAVDSITRGMRIDLVKHGIKVSLIEPGAVETEFSIVRFKGDKERADNVYKGFSPLFAQDIADAVYYVCSLPAHVNINDMLIVPTAQASATIIEKKL
ncbi:MAG: SDR family NAD(P)-dependent oxidoreductase [Bacteroidetes bacterium]|nr:SDR family NAD(P)-dependent oxidoreductase [Bacteroidota bacterium]